MLNGLSCPARGCIAGTPGSEVLLACACSDSPTRLSCSSAFERFSISFISVSPIVGLRSVDIWGINIFSCPDSCFCKQRTSSKEVEICRFVFDRSKKFWIEFIVDKTTRLNRIPLSIITKQASFSVFLCVCFCLRFCLFVCLSFIYPSIKLYIYL